MCKNTFKQTRQTLTTLFICVLSIIKSLLIIYIYSSICILISHTTYIGWCIHEWEELIIKFELVFQSLIAIYVVITFVCLYTCSGILQ